MRGIFPNCALSRNKLHNKLKFVRELLLALIFLCVKNIPKHEINFQAGHKQYIQH